MNPDFELKGLIKTIESDLGKTEWIEVYSDFSEENKYKQGTYFSAFVKNEYLQEVLKDYSWDLMIGQGMPGFNTHWEKGKEINTYRNYNDDSIYPIVFRRYFPVLKVGYFEPLQEFCHYFDLFEDKKTNIYYFIDDCGEKIEVIKITENSVKIKLKFLKDFAAAKGLSIILFFEAMNFEDKSVKDLGLEETNTITKTDELTYSLAIRNCNISEEMVSQSWLLGKKIIKGTKDFKHDFFGKNKDYENYIIDIDENGNDILFTCDEEELANYFGKNEGKPHFLTPVCFRKDVLKKYYDNTTKYSVEDGTILANGLWSLRIDNNLDDYVVVFLGDLGRLPSKEQLHWKQYNVAGVRKLSHTTFQRSFMGEFADPEQPDLHFKFKFERFRRKWREKFSYDLFLPLKDEDMHYYSSLHSPLSNEVKEFEEQILAISKILIDSINEKEIYKGVKNKKDGDKGIDKFEKFVNENIGNFPEMIDFFRNLYNLRSSGIAHRKGSNYEKAKKYYEIEKLSFKEIFNRILIDAIKTINTLEGHFLK